MPRINNARILEGERGVSGVHTRRLQWGVTRTWEPQETTSSVITVEPGSADVPNERAWDGGHHRQAVAIWESPKTFLRVHGIPA